MLWRSLEVLKLFSPPADASTPHYQDVRETVEAMHFYADELLESVTNLTNLQLSLSSQKTNQVMRILTVVLGLLPAAHVPRGCLRDELRVHAGVLAARGDTRRCGPSWSLITLGIYLWFRQRGWLKL